MVQTKIIPIVNKNLFSNYYLDNRVKTIPEWKKNDHIVAFSEIKKLYEEERKSFENFNEAQLIKHFLDPIFKILLFESEVEEAVGGEFPDYAFFRDKNSRDEAHKNKGTISFYTNALAIGEVKKWVTELDGKPIHQLRNYLDVTEKKWGILTNGRKWRLFCKEKKRDEYYEVDLPSLLDSNDVEGFKYFFYFFRRDAFLFPDSFLEGVLRESEVHAKTIGNNLKENVYKAMKKIAEGFFGRPQNNLDRNDEAARERVQKNTMLLLYRLLFLLYAEDRNLLDLTNTKYLNNHSFRRIKKEVEEKRGRIEQGYDYSGTTIWDRLKSLFELINVGSEAIGEKEFHVPAYNGGLFDTKKNPELDEKWKIGDKYLAEAIHLLTWSDVNGAGGFVDYSELEIRHLGSIYEGLLEYKLKVAESDIVAKENEWVSLEKYNEGRKQKKAFEEFDEFSRARKGELYLATDKGERKATGSYYTPDYIVNYIVRNTIGVVVDKKWKEAQEKNKNFIDATLSVKVFDPAMGSGHFLVGAVDFLAEKLLNAAQKDIEAGRLAEEAQYSDLDWARREVVAHCIYGVDLNPMAVELAKVSLWLKTISKDKPLSFLDHRLKCGNSLIGAKLLEVAWYPPELLSGSEKKDAEKRKKEREQGQQTFEIPFIKAVADLIAEIDKETDETITGILRKKEIFDKLTESDEYKRLKTICDLYTGLFLSAKPLDHEREKWGNYVSSFFDPKNKEWIDTPKYGWPKKGLEIAHNKKFFHWELEFPEIFFKGGRLKENPGFDAVVGNPPYLRIQELQKADPSQVDYFNVTFVSATGSYDIYILFNEFGLQCLKRNGRLGMIQLSKFIQADFGKGIRKILPKYLDKIIDFRENQIFDVSTYTCLLFLSKIDQENWSYFATPTLKNVENEMPRLLNQKIDFSLISKDLSDAPWVLSNQDNLKILQKLNLFPERLHDVITNIFQGIATSADHIYFLEEIEKIGIDKIKVFSHSTNSEWILETNYLKPLLKGEDVHRYEPLEPKIWTIFPYDLSNQNPRLLSSDELKNRSPKLWEYLKLNEVELRKREHGRFDNDEWWQFSRPQNLTLYNKKKIMTPDICKRGEISYDRVGYCHTTTVYSFVFKDECQENILFWNSILNSSLLWYFISNTGSILRGGFFRFKTNYLKPFPIRRISFTTPKEERNKLLDDLKQKYQDSQFDTVLKIMDECLPKDKKGDFITEKEKSDVVHDFLAFLAEQMIEMNKEKNRVVKDFLEWMQSAIETKPEILTGRTKLKQYYILDFDELLTILKNNKKRIPVNISSLQFHKNLKEGFETSKNVLTPLRIKIEVTDNLIDQIVYKLYGLTEEEIRIVEGSIGKK